MFPGSNHSAGGWYTIMKHSKGITRIPRLAASNNDDSGTGTTPFAVKIDFLVKLVDRGVIWVMQKHGGSL